MQDTMGNAVPGMGSNRTSPLAGFSPAQIFVGGIISGVLVLCTIGFFILLSLVMKGGGFAAFAAGNSGGNAAPTQPAPSAGAPTAVSVTPVDEKTDHILGSKNAKVTLIEYSDFECPFCGKFYPTMKQAIENFEGKIRVVYRHFPLSFHPEAQPAAEASECAAEQGKFWEFHDKLFENQTSLSASYYEQVAKELRLNESKFKDCVATNKYADKVRAQAATANTTGLEGTPHTLVVGPNGDITVVGGAQPYSALEAAIKKYVQ